MKVGSPLWNRLFGTAAEVEVEESGKAEERIARIQELTSRVGFKYEMVEWLSDEIRKARIVPGPHEDMLYRTGFRDGLEFVADRLRLLQQTAREK